VNDGNLRSQDLGKLSLELSAKTWGFAGASLMLARNLTPNERLGAPHALLGTPATSATIRETTTRHPFANRKPSERNPPFLLRILS